MSIFMWATTALMLLALVVANSDNRPRLQMWAAVILYLTLVIQTVIWIVGW